jgi:hypothetical protein
VDDDLVPVGCLDPLTGVEQFLDRLVGVVKWPKRGRHAASNVALGQQPVGVAERGDTHDDDRAAAVMALRERDAIRDGRLLLVSGVVLAVVTTAFVLHTVLHLQPSVVALVGGLVLLAASRLHAEEVAKDVEWPTLVFFAGLFVMVGALVATG